ncbi:acetate kinase [Bradyrhizobium sp. AS23.2]|uniref:acetate kinase n=1 Tax=Bradyrhizobium sp. AS23.2 TaxID=1680155 RepID=UPI00093ADB70|nr:acetate kinase [Bradyrhizobium sp. AS23.2]OKO84362.1 acetate kinase [Bradyrhizobium sp. AS23.2]
MDSILAIDANAGGVNFQLFAVQGEGRLERQIKGRLDGLGSFPRLKASGANGDPLAHRAYRNDDVGDVPAAFAVVDTWLRDELGIRPLAVGHRVVQGGTDYVRPVIVDDAVMADLERMIAFAPQRQPHNLVPIRTILANYPALPQVACFDTAFHLARPAVSEGRANPHRPGGESIARWGFHGLSYESIARTLSLVAPEVAKGRVIIARLDNSSSMCALRDGRSVESTSAFYAFGAPMSDEIDPGTAVFLTSGSEMRSGLSDAYADAPEPDASGAFLASGAVERLAYRAGLNAGLLAAALEGLDAFVFTGAIGESSATIRACIAERLGWLGAVLDESANVQHARVISRRESRIPIYVLPSDDELAIARHTLALLLNRPSSQ